MRGERCIGEIVVMANEEPTLVPSKVSIITELFNAVIAEVKDAKTLVLRILAMLFGLICYFIVSNQDQIVDLIKNYGDSSSIEKIEKDRAAKYPALAREKAAFIYSLVGADFVIVLEYEPIYQNNQADVLAYEGKTPIDLAVWKDIPLNKGSIAYNTHLAGEEYISTIDFSKPSIVDTESLVNKKFMQTLEAGFTYSYPIYNLTNSYSGSIIVGWKTKPEGNISELIKFVDSVVYPSARALGRAK